MHISERGDKGQDDDRHDVLEHADTHSEIPGPLVQQPRVV